MVSHAVRTFILKVADERSHVRPQLRVEIPLEDTLGDICSETVTGKVGELSALSWRMYRP